MSLPVPVCVIMAGGAGTRFWPLSSDAKPKQFLNLIGNQTFLQQSYERARTLCPASHVLVFTHADYRSLVEEQLPELDSSNIYCEPQRRDTAAAIAWSSLVCQKRFGSCVVMTLTSDHWIQPLQDFAHALKEFHAGAANSDSLYTMGILPTWPSTGYGYLELGQQVQVPECSLAHFELRRFREKPNRETAEEFIESGRFLWNSGMFAWRIEVILEMFRLHLPHHLEVLEPVCLGEAEEIAKAFPKLQKISIDYAILEKAPSVRCLQPKFQWSDLGGWASLTEFLETTEGNHRRGQIFPLDSRDNLVYCDDQSEEVALVGVQGLTVVRMGKKTLVLPTQRGEEIKQLLQKFPQLNQ